uniref:Uncharacterized protein n=1 Tax=Clastoptera arizonana TaxID=38151 RepID=A0A1B6D5V5_9HEMI
MFCMVLTISENKTLSESINEVQDEIQDLEFKIEEKKRILSETIALEKSIRQLNNTKPSLRDVTKLNDTKNKARIYKICLGNWYPCTKGENVEYICNLKGKCKKVVIGTSDSIKRTELMWAEISKMSVNMSSDIELK